jgi:hypothetical protein
LYYNKNVQNAIKTFFVVMAAETLSGGETGGGGEWGLEVQLNLMPPGVPKVNLFSLFWVFRAASC